MLASLIAGAAGAGCSSGTEPPSSAPSVLLARAHGYGPCSLVWEPRRPPVRRTLVDFFFGSGDTGPTEAQVAAVEAAGGQVVYRFNIPRLRAEIDVAAVPNLVRLPPHGPAYAASTVPDPANRDVVLVVRLSHDLTDADIAAVEALGGTIRHRYEFVGGDGYSVKIDDAAVPQVRALPGVERASGGGTFCLGDS